jgi:RNA polymerase sigma-54 factor
LQLVEKKDPKLIAKVTKSTEEEARETLKIILGMEPKPGRSFSDERVQYIVPDIYVHKVGDEYVVVLNEDGLPKLRISNYYRQLLQGKGKTGDLTKGYIQEKLRSAVWMIKSIHQRQRTIYKVAKSLVKFQRDFFDKGVEYLKPLSLKDVAQDISMHESTVSRVTNSKYMHTPQGIHELKFFFNSSVNTTSGGEISAESVKQKISQIITTEDVARPHSDQEITRILREMGVDIARRTVTKYRESMNILSSTKRKKYL